MDYCKSFDLVFLVDRQIDHFCHIHFPFVYKPRQPVLVDVEDSLRVEADSMYSYITISLGASCRPRIWLPIFFEKKELTS